MGKKWLVAVKRVFSPKSKEKNGQRRNKSKKRWGFGQCSNFKQDSIEDSAYNDNLVPLAPQETCESVVAENDRSKHAYSVALASAVAAEAAVVAAQAAAEVVRLTKSTKFTARSKEEVASIKIQTTFRGYLARRALRALRGLVRLRSLTNSNSVKHQAAAALCCMQTMARVQVQIHSRRIRMSEEIQALQRQLHLKHERELEKLRVIHPSLTTLNTSLLKIFLSHMSLTTCKMKSLSTQYSILYTNSNLCTCLFCFYCLHA